MAYLGAFYRTYALDFWGFGESGKKRETYAVSDFVSLVNQFMEQLGIVHAPLVGHSMGGTVSLSVAHPVSGASQQGGGGWFAHGWFVSGAFAQTRRISFHRFHAVQYDGTLPRFYEILLLPRDLQ